MAKVTVIARIKAADGKIDFLKSKFKTLIPLVKKEEGCIQYSLHQDNEDPSIFMFYETWASPELLQAHGAYKNLQNFQKEAKDAIAEFIVNKLTLIA